LKITVKAFTFAFNKFKLKTKVKDFTFICNTFKLKSKVKDFTSNYIMRIFYLLKYIKVFRVLRDAQEASAHLPLFLVGEKFPLLRTLRLRRPRHIPR